MYFALKTAASNGELSSDGSGVKTESKGGGLGGVGGDEGETDGYDGLSIPIEGDGVKIETDLEGDEPILDDNTGKFISIGQNISHNLHKVQKDFVGVKRLEM